MTHDLDLMSAARGFGTWIPMDYQLPPTRTPVLILTHDGTITAAELLAELWWPIGIEGYEIQWSWQNEELPWGGVTHWMPLPKAPKKVEA